MARHGAIATAALLLPLGSCLWEEPITPQPTPVDSAVTIPPGGVYPYQQQLPANGTNCTFSIQISDVHSPQGQALNAEFYLNFESQYHAPTLPLTIGQATQIPLQLQTGSTTEYYYGPNENIPFDLTEYPADLLPPLTPAEVALIANNVLTLFVSDGFPVGTNSPLQPANSTHTTDQWSWQLVPDTQCAATLAALDNP